ncbi:hypothetical protein SUGI_0949840 [Cryptomeria japonica]|nr:hypothetical protein SUGI_0949840 [Cryptomeria japonica]
MKNPHEAHGFLETPVWVKKDLEREMGGQIVVHGMERTSQSHCEQQHSNLQKSWQAFSPGESLQKGIQKGSVNIKDVFSLFISEEFDKVVLSYINFVLPMDLGPVLNLKKVVAAILLVVLGINSSSSVDEIKNILKTVGIDYDDERIELLLGNLK